MPPDKRKPPGGGSGRLSGEDVEVAGVDTSRIPPQRFLSIEQVADVIQLSTKQVRRIIKRGELAHHRFGRLYRISPADLDSFLAQRRKGE